MAAMRLLRQLTILERLLLVALLLGLVALGVPLVADAVAGWLPRAAQAYILPILSIAAVTLIAVTLRHMAAGLSHALSHITDVIEALASAELESTIRRPTAR